MTRSEQINKKMSELEKAIGSGGSKLVFDEVIKLVTDALWQHDTAALKAYKTSMQSIFMNRFELSFIVRMTREPGLPGEATRLLDMVEYALEAYEDQTIEPDSPTHQMLKALYGAGTISASSVAQASGLSDVQVLQAGNLLESNGMVQRTFGGTVVFWGITPSGCQVHTMLSK
jgi:hypothetical protein